MSWLEIAARGSWTLFRSMCVGIAIGKGAAKVSIAIEDAGYPQASHIVVWGIMALAVVVLWKTRKW